MKIQQKSKTARSKTRITDEKYLDLDEIQVLLSFVEKEKNKALRKRKTHPVQYWFFVNTALSTGLRIEEMTDLKCGDGYLKNGLFTIKIRSGKGDKPGSVICSKSYEEKFYWYIDWKEQHDYSISEDAPLFYSRITKKQMTTRAFQKAFKILLKKANLKTTYTPHCLRHTYATFLNSVSGNIRLVQEQLRHESINTTQRYASVLPTGTKTAIEAYQKLLGL